MRNLKKVLSLALALVMLVGMMTIGASAVTYTDSDQVTKTAAVNIMSGIGVLTGTDTGAFNPQGNLNREQAAKILACMTLGPNVANILTATSAPFADVPANSWSAGYISYCSSSAGGWIITGMDDGLFHPWDTLTVTQFAKMLLVAIGNDPYRYIGDTWAINVQTDSLKTNPKLIDNVGITNWNAAITREQASQMAFNALTHTDSGNATGRFRITSTNPSDALHGMECASMTEGLMMISVLDATNKANYSVNPITDNTGSLADTVFGLKGTTGVVTRNQATSADKFTTIDGTTKFAVETGLDLIGHNVTVYYRNASSMPSTGYTTYLVTDNSTTYVIPANMDDAALAAALGRENLTGITWNHTTYDGTYAVDSTASGANAAQPTRSNAGNTLVIYDKKVVSMIAPTAYTLDKVTAVATDGSKITFNTTNIGGDKAIPADRLVLHDAIAKDDYVVVNTVGSFFHVSKAQTITGAPTKIDDTTVTIGGVAYAKLGTDGSGLIAVNASAMAFGTDYTLYLDGQGNYIVATGVAVTSTPEYYYVVDAYKITGVADEWGNTDDRCYVQLVDLDGNQVLKKTASDFTGTVGGNGANKDDLKLKDKKGELCTLSYNSDGEVTGFTPATSTAATTSAAIGAAVPANSAKIAANAYYANNVKFIYISGSMGSLKITVKNGAQALASTDVVIYTKEDVDGTNNSVKYVIVKGAYTEAPVAGTGVMYAAEAADSEIRVPYTKADGTTGTAWEHTVYIDGVKTTILTAGTDADDALNGGFVPYTKDNATGIYTVGVYGTTGWPAAPTNLKTATNIDNMYNGLITIASKSVVDVSVAGATVVNLVSGANASKVPTDPTKLSTDDTVALVLNADGTAVVTIYVTETDRT